MKNKIILLVLVIALALNGCGTTATNNQEDGEYKIGFSIYSMVIERWQRDRDIFVSKAQELGAQVNTQNANGDAAKQKEQIDYLIAQNMDVIVIIAADTNDLSDSVEKARSKGIKVIAYDRLIEGTMVDLFITFDSYEIGTMLGNELKKKFPQGADLVEIMGSETDSNVALYESGIEDCIKGTKIRIKKKAYATDWVAENAFNTVSEYLKENKTMDAIVCGNDDLANQAIKALSEQRKAGKVYVLGQDGDLSACQRIVEGTQGGTVFKNVDDLAKQAALDAFNLAKGEVLEETQTCERKGQTIPCRYMTPQFVDKENMDEIVVNSGFHAREDIYLNE